jgi:beta-1,2-mannobiose phosphorylase / 1,2-beta-oligomannan phosphorylase
MKTLRFQIIIIVFLPVISTFVIAADTPADPPHSSTPLMFYTDTSFGGSFAKDPDVVRFKGRYYMYYTTHRGDKGIAVGIATSDNLIRWTKVADMLPAADYETNGLGAPAAIILGNKVHLFYQTYGNGPKDAICHAISDDGIHFKRNETNPVFSPTGDWTCGRAIDAEVVVDGSRMLLYWATRNPEMKIQMIGVSSAPMDSGFGRNDWKQICQKPILKPELPWEGACIESASPFKHNGKFYMFYAGSYNATPQQIGIAVSEDGVNYKRMSEKPLLPNGTAGTWNAHESGHPGVFVDDDGKMYLFYQGTNDKGATWYLSRMDILWDNDKLYLVSPRDGEEFHLK